MDMIWVEMHVHQPLLRSRLYESLYAYFSPDTPATCERGVKAFPTQHFLLGRTCKEPWIMFSNKAGTLYGKCHGHGRQLVPRTLQRTRTKSASYERRASNWLGLGRTPLQITMSIPPSEYSDASTTHTAPVLQKSNHQPESWEVSSSNSRSSSQWVRNILSATGDCDKPGRPWRNGSAQLKSITPPCAPAAAFGC